MVFYVCQGILLLWLATMLGTDFTLEILVRFGSILLKNRDFLK
jgi:hypothetical protein